MDEVIAIKKLIENHPEVPIGFGHVKGGLAETT
jgi:hypothetical protein